MRILILAALSQEYSPLKKLLPFSRVKGGGPEKKFACEMPDKEIILIECGMGKEAAGEALRHGLSEFNPDLLLFSGFAGGIHSDLSVGIVCFVETVLDVSSKNILNFRVPKEVLGFLEKNAIRPVLALTGETAGDKLALSALAGERMAVLDMETSTVAEIAVRNEVPFICLRAVSDGLNDNLGFNLGDISDERGRIRLGGVLATVITKPSTIKAFYLSWRRSRLAAANLCGLVATFLNIPASRLREVVDEIRVEMS